jgi:HEAT repeat protein
LLPPTTLYPSILDRVDGVHLGAVTRDSTIARAALTSIAEPLFSTGSEAIQVALADAVGRLRLETAAEILSAKVRSAPAAPVRVAALQALAAMRDRRAETALRIALDDRDALVRMTALNAIPALHSDFRKRRQPRCSRRWSMAAGPPRNDRARSRRSVRMRAQLPVTC